MYDVKSLENDWNQYKSKRRRPFIILFVFLALISVLFFNFKSLVNVNLKKYYDYFTIHSINNKHSKSLILLNKNLVELEISIASENNISINNINSNLLDVPIFDTPLVLENNLHKSNKLNIIQTNSMSAYKDVENRFKQAENIDDAFFLAKSYYKKGNYEKSAYWALEANKIDDTLEESIFIFINSKVKLGQKNEAISILKKYIEKTNTIEAKNLLYNIENNKI